MKIKLVLLFLTYSLAKAQVGLINQYQFNYLAINPALAGENSPFTLKGLAGRQFNGSVNFNSVNQLLVLDGQLYNKSGLAFQGYRNNAGNIINTGLGMSYAKGFEIGELKLKIGANAGFSIQPNLLSAQISQRVMPHTGLGVFGIYKNVFLGVSNPMLVASKRIFEPQPFLANLGYIYDSESLLSFNLNTLYYYDFNSKKNNIDFNLKIWLIKRFSMGASYRINNLYSFYQKNKSFLPFVEYNATKSLNFGLSYNSNVVDHSNISTNNLQLGGIFQFMIQYNNNEKGGDSWLFNKF
jgi:type IX secretion system PorP/SprF family membrane protein